MERNSIHPSKSVILKWFALLAFVFSLSVPFTAELCLAGDTYQVHVDSGYLALRTGKSYDKNNEIGELYTGDLVTVNDYSDSTYWYVYAPKLDRYGYVNKDHLISMDSTSASWTVSVDKGYLALRTGKSFNRANEIGELYSGDTVEVHDSSDSTYWYVYSPKLNKYGYVNKEYLISPSSRSTGDTRTVRVSKGYLALRSAKSYDSSNEIGELYNGDTVQVLETSDPDYWYVYSSKLDRYGYVNKDYLEGGSSNDTRTVSVSKGYLALRSAKSYNSSNEIGELYNGDKVQLIDTSDSSYWYVYSPKLSKYGYVNKDYLSGGSSYSSVTVHVDKGYLALRSAKSYDSSNEIGQLNNGDTLQVINTEDSVYWYVYSSKLDRYGYVNREYLN